MTREGPLAGLRIVEISAFVAAPFAGMTLAQLGAEVVRIDPIGGQIDFTRWPISSGGESLFWSGLNKGKRSVTVDFRTPEGRELALALMAAPGEGNGIVVTNLSTAGWMSYANLRERREDVILASLTGNFDGSKAVDYTVNAASGFPISTGEDSAPVNHLLPAWDFTAGLYLATGVLAAHRARRDSGVGQHVTVALSDVMLSVVSALGYLGDVEINKESRTPQGNYLYGAFGKDFATADGERVMVVAITNRQWRNLCKATRTTQLFEELEGTLGLSFADEGSRYQAREFIQAVLARWFRVRRLDEVRSSLDDGDVLWSPYRTFGQLFEQDERASLRNPMFAQVEHPGIGPMRTPGSPLHFSATQEPRPMPSPELGSFTETARDEALRAGLVM